LATGTLRRSVLIHPSSSATCSPVIRHMVSLDRYETSTGALQSGRALCAAAHDARALVIADCVTLLGGIPVNFDQTGIDVAYSCTQRRIELPTGPVVRLLFRGGPWTGCALEQIMYSSYLGSLRVTTRKVARG
jgi:kynureninase